MEGFKKIAIVTGGASGIGKALCSELVYQNVFVIIADINDTEGKLFEKELNKNSNNSRYITLNVTDFRSVFMSF
ncbi:SDR family NAD(P)-dependent oxidoreductase [Paenisporosarcina quisquiliarum]|uniref:SDR family NAD(P)-dependent oxidoreductase n=1 Tax=Paenisporosarcina quisquiliarum TaxID=365346 RepID=UPI003735A1BB